MINIDAVRSFALGLPATQALEHFELWSARVGTRIFLTWPPDGSRVHVFTDDAQTADAIEAGIGEPLLWGKKVAGLKVKLPADPATLLPLIELAWRRKATKRVVAAYDAHRAG